MVLRFRLFRVGGSFSDTGHVAIGIEPTCQE